MDVLCFDIGSGGITGARINERLEVVSLKEATWDLQADSIGRATLSPSVLESAFKSLISSLHGDEPVAAIAIACFMHSFLLLDFDGRAVTPIFTWMDTTATKGVAIIRSKVGSEFHVRTGCRYHPMFPVF